VLLRSPEQRTGEGQPLRVYVPSAHGRRSRWDGASLLWRSLYTVWHFIREVSGDDAYERYCAHQRLRHPRAPLMSRREFSAEATVRKWSGVSRCC